MAVNVVVINWNPEAIYGPLTAAHEAAADQAAKVASDLAPGSNIQVSAEPIDANRVQLTARGPGAVFQEFGVGPHEIVPDDGEVLAGEDFGPFAGPVDHPGNPAIGYVHQGADAYPNAFISEAQRQFR